jgi:hypothetical protein
MPTVKMYIGNAIQQSIVSDNIGITITADSTQVTADDDSSHTVDEE